MSDTTHAVQIIHGFDSGGIAGAKLEIVELQYENINIASLVESIDYDATAISLDPNDQENLLKTVTIKLNELGTGDVELEDTTNSILTWKSENTAVATVTGTQITAVAGGTTKVYGTLKGTSITGPDIMVTVMASPSLPTADNDLYLYGSAATIASELTDLPSIETRAKWQYYGGYDGTIEVTESRAQTGNTFQGADNSVYYRILTATGSADWAAGGVGGDPVDISSIGGISFYIKAPTSLSSGKTPAQSVKIIFEFKGATISTHTIMVTSDWEKHEVALSENTDYSQIDTIKYELINTTDEVLVDEVLVYKTGVYEIDLYSDIFEPDDSRNIVNVTEYEFDQTITTQWIHHRGYDGTITVEDQTTGGADTTVTDGGPFLRLTRTGMDYGAGGWGEEPIVDLGAYDAIVFSAKSNSAATSSILFGLVDETNYGVNVKRDITSTWQQYTILFTEFTSNNVPVNVSKMKLIRYVLENNNDIVDIDEVYLRDK